MTPAERKIRITFARCQITSALSDEDLLNPVLVELLEGHVRAYVEARRDRKRVDAAATASTL